MEKSGERGVDHLAVAVANLDEAAGLYRALGFEVGEAESVAGEKVRLRKCRRDGFCVELLEAWPAGEGAIGKFLARRGPGLHHLALRTDNLALELQRLEKAGILPLPGYPAVGSEGTRVAFLDPKGTGGVLVEVVEKAE